MVTFKSNGHTCDGYIAGSGPGVLVIQEWWGLVPHIKDVVDRLAEAGFTALAPDLYHGESSTEPDGAGKLMMALNLEQAAKDLSGAIALLQERSGAPKVGVVGYCMGGGLALVVASQRPDAVAAVAPYYGVIPWATAQPDAMVWLSIVSVVDRRLRRPRCQPGAAGTAARVGQGRHAAHPPGYAARVLQRRPPRGVRRCGRDPGVGPHAGAVPHHALTAPVGRS